LTRGRSRSLLGTRHEVLIEKGARRGGLLQGRTRQHQTVLVPGDASLIGSYLTVELTGTTGSTFTGAPVSPRAALPMAG
jgi:tRNA-2-methylthio-N6-dimethylallyladenosine synthase